MEGVNQSFIKKSAREGEKKLFQMGDLYWGEGGGRVILL